LASTSVTTSAGQTAAQPPQSKPAIWFFLLLLVTVAYQAVYCHTMTRDDWTGLFFTGAAIHRPAELGGFVYPGDGYDGQMYRIIAHDPLAKKGEWKYMDDPRYRSRRAMVPLLAALAGGGSPQLTDFAFIAITDILLALGGLCFVLLARDFCRPLIAAALYLLVPTVVAATDRLVLDGALLAAFLAAWLFYRYRRTSLLFSVLALAPLIRETGICVTAGVAVAYMAVRKYRHAAGALLTVIPAASWWWFAAQHTAKTPIPGLLSVPLLPQMLRLFTLFERPGSRFNSLFESLDVIACVCLLIAFACLGKALWDGLRDRHIGEDVLLVLPFAVLAALSSSRPIMIDPYAFMRVNGPLLAWASLWILRTRPAYALLYVPASSAALVVFRVNPILRFLGIVLPA
jgi:hypothetical protein